MKKTVSNQGVKRRGSSTAGGSGSKATKQPPKQVEIFEDVWIEALKHLTCPKWSKMRLVSRQLNGVVQRNVSRLPLAVINRAEIKYKERKRIETKIIILESTISPDVKWFKNGTMNIDLPAVMQLNKAIVGIELKDNFCADLCILGPAQKKKPLTPYEKGRPWFSGNSKFPAKQFKANILFYGEFRPHQNQSSLASMAFFLKVLYDPSTYVKTLSMYPLEAKLKDFLFSGEEERYIRCRSFNLQVNAWTSADEVCEYESWLEQNVQADIIQFPLSYSATHTAEHDTQICDAVSNYVFCSSWKSANQTVKLGYVNNLPCFFQALIRKFQTVSTAQSIFPRIEFSGYERPFSNSLDKLLSENGTVKEKRGVLEIYTISNGSNRMRIQISRQSEGVNYNRYPDITVTFEASE